MIWTFKQERNCCTISVCYSGCEMTPRRNSFARRQPPIQPVLDASFLLMQRSGTHALCVELTGSHLPVLSGFLRAYCIVCGGKNQAEINIFLLIPGIIFWPAQNLKHPFRLRPLAARRAPPGQKRRADNFKQRCFCVVIFMSVQKVGKRGFKFVIHHKHTPNSCFLYITT